MLREFAINVYLIVFRLLFNFFNMFANHNKTTFITSFNGNVEDTIIELKNKMADDHQIIILKNSNCKLNFGEERHYHILNFEKAKHFIQSIYHLATSRYIIADNYYGFLAVTNFKKDVKCVQLWHAAGAIKQFGLTDRSNEYRTERAIKRFQTVYNRFDHVVVGSDKMNSIFKDSFGLHENRYIRIGIPRTDFVYDEIRKSKAIDRLQSDFTKSNSKKVIMYAPTYRDGEFNSVNLQIDLEQIYEHFKHDYVLFLRLHPAVNSKFRNKYPDFIYNVSNYFSINHLLLGTDILITDYSSIPFEFSLLNKPMIFYAYDLDEYIIKRGLWKDYTNQVPGPVVTTTDELIQVIKKQDFHLEKVKSFANEWNKYSKGNSCENLIKSLYDVGAIEHTEKARENV